MGRPYCCTTCGSRVVVHRCASILAATRCAEPMPVAIALELPPSPPPAPPSPPVQTSPPAARPLITSSCAARSTTTAEPRKRKKLCDAPGCTADAERTLRGFDDEPDGRRIRRRGDALCNACYLRHKMHIEDAIPMPPARPGGYLVARTRQLKTVERRVGVAVAWCRGDLLRAVELYDSASSRVMRPR